MEHYKNRLICFLDVLGFSAMLDKIGIEELYNKYSEFVDIANSKVFFARPENYEGPTTNFEISEIVSDSIVLVSHDTENIVSTNNFIGAIHFFLELGLINGFMFRGGINLGDIIFDKQRRIFLSKEYNKLAKFEPTMNIPACVIFDEAKQTIMRSLFGANSLTIGAPALKSLPIVKWAIPLKDKTITEGIKKDLWCVNFTHFCDEKQINSAIDYLAGDPIKQANFIEYLKFLDCLPEEWIPINNETIGDARLKLMKSRSGIRFALVHSDGKITESPFHWSFPTVFIEPPAQIQIIPGSEPGQVVFQAIGRWKDADDATQGNGQEPTEVTSSTTNG